MSETETQSIYENYKDEFKYSSNNWYYYSNHKWNLDKNGDEIKKKIGELNSYKELFFDKNFEDNLDSNDNLLHFLNGVYDIDKNEFRKGVPDDNISMTTGINYIEKLTSQSCEKIIQIDDFLDKIFPIESVKKYVLNLLSSFLHGANKGQKFHIWDGSGSNGKSTLIDLYKKTIGNYSGSLNIRTLTHICDDSAPNSLASTRNKRFISVDESEVGAEIQICHIKELTDCNEITVDKLYSDPITFKPKFGLVLVCNELPKLSHYDDDVRIVEFISRFCNEPKKSYEYINDSELTNKLDDWREAFMYTLIQYYQKSYKIHGLIEPDVVKLNTEVFNKYNSYNKNFAEKCIQADPLGKISIDDIFGPFRSFLFNSGMSPSKYTMYSRRVFENCMNNILGQCDSFKKWNGWKLISGYNSPQPNLTQTQTPPPPPSEKRPMMFLNTRR